MTYIGYLGERGLYLVSIKQDYYIRFERANKSKTAFQHSKQDFNWGYLIGLIKHSHGLENDPARIYFLVLKLLKLSSRPIPKSILIAIDLFEI